MDNILEVSQFSASYGTKKILSDLVFELPKTTCIGLIGPNGAGKTTLIKGLLGLIEITGKIVFNDTVVFDDTIDKNQISKIRKKIGYFPESSSYYQHLSPREYLTMIGNLLDYSPETTSKKVDALIEQLGLVRWADQMTSSLSKGNLQRLSLATTFMQEPELMLLDEPFSGIAPGGRRALKDIIKNFTTIGLPELGMNTPGTVLLSSHILGDLDELCQYFLLMDTQGDIVWKGSKKDIGVTQPVETVEELYLTIVEE